MDKIFPYKDVDLNCWIYDRIPDKMEPATSPKQLLFGTLILFKATFSSIQGYFVATKVYTSNKECVLHKMERGEIFILKRGISKT